MSSCRSAPRKGLASLALVVLPLILAACADPQKACEAGLPELKARLDKVVGYTEHPDVNQLMTQARQQYGEALSAYRRGNYDACSDGLEQVEILLDKAKRVRRELAT